jgi:restriction system protein
MTRRGGVIVQIQREMARQARAAERTQVAYVRDQQRAHREAERAYKAAQREVAADAKRSKELYAEARLAEVAAANADLAAKLGDLTGLLTSTLDVDDFIDIAKLRKAVRHPAFDPGSHGQSIPPPLWEQFAPAPPTGLGKLFGGKVKYEQAVAAARHQFAAAQGHHQAAERARHGALSHAQARYTEECVAREDEVAAANAGIDAFAAAFAAGDPNAIVEYFDLVLGNSVYPGDFPQHYRLACVPESKQLVVEYDLPTLDVVPTVREYRYVRSKDEITSSARPAKDVKALYASVVAQMTLRTLHELFEADRAGWIDTVVFNGIVSTTDPATGKPVTPCLVTVRTTKDVFADIDLRKVDPLACLVHLNASVSKKPDELAPVRPVLEFDMVDKRFVEETDVLSDLDQRPNLLDMTPSEFEALIQNLFAKMGLDTKQTRASRDGGVDCVAFDPRPIFGGKVVVQAKRYRNTVDVSAVRDLYGTMQNEGASKGILVATSGYGPTSYQFASGKPLELIDGSNLLYLLAQHAGIEARIVPPEQ